MSFRRVSSLDDLWSGEMVGLEIDGKAILLINLDDHVRAYADACPHQKCRLSEGRLLGTTLRCARHQWEFDVGTGQGTNPRNACLKALPVAIDGRDILLDLDDDAGASDAAAAEESQG
jgi:toluene monooxygenase system ferredoxin subunit